MATREENSSASWEHSCTRFMPRQIGVSQRSKESEVESSGDPNYDDGQNVGRKRVQGGRLLVRAHYSARRLAVFTHDRDRRRSRDLGASVAHIRLESQIDF